MNAFRLSVSFVSVLLLCSQPGAAQTAFAGGGVFAETLRFGHVDYSSPFVAVRDPSGNVSGWFLTGGGTLARHAILLAEGGVSTEQKGSFEPPRYLTPGVYGSMNQTFTYRARHVRVLAGYVSNPERHVTVAALAGLMFVQERITSRSVFTLPPGVPPPPYPILPDESSATTYRVGPAFGLDVAASVGPHVQIVPQVRLYRTSGYLPLSVYTTSNGPLGIHAGIGARWRF